MTDDTSCKYIPDKSRDERVEDALAAAAEAVGGPLTRDKYDAWHENVADEHPSSGQIQIHLGATWRDICRERDIPAAGYSDEEIVESIRTAAKNEGIPISRGEYDSWRHEQSETYPASETIYRQMGWLEACAEAGVPAHQMQIPKKNIISSIQQAAEAKGEPLTAREYKRWRDEAGEAEVTPPCGNTIIDRLGWVGACQQAGVEHGEIHPEYTRDEVVDALTSAFDAIGEALSASKYEDWGNTLDEQLPSAGYIADELGDGSWIDACSSLDIPTPTTTNTSD